MSTSKQKFDNGTIFRRKGVWFRVTVEPDDCTDSPTQRADGHGHVSVLQTGESDEELKAKKFWVLTRDRGRVVAYDVVKSMEIAIRDCWGPGKSMSAKRRAVRRDYEFLRGWYQSEWTYIGIVVERLTGPRKGEHESIWGIESCSQPSYLWTTARELADMLL